MTALKPYRVTVNYFGIKLPFRVYQIIQNNKVEIYQLKCHGLTYIVIKDDRKWSFMAVLDPCQELKDVIIARLQRREIPISPSQRLNSAY